MDLWFLTLEFCTSGFVPAVELTLTKRQGAPKRTKNKVRAQNAKTKDQNQEISQRRMILIPFSTIYGALMRARREAYRRGWLAVSSLPAPVISVGNLTTGGTGKTPLVEWICRRLAEDNHNVCVLTRGYRRENPKTQVLVSNGKELLATEREAGDEPYLLARNLLGIAAVVCNSDRVQAGRWAIENLGCKVFVLDDGFQHQKLARDLDIVTIDATNPWGGGALLPEGRLREPLEGLARADCVVMTRVEQQENLQSLAVKVKDLADEIPIFNSRMLPSQLRPMVNHSFDPSKRSMGAFCGVGNAESFFNLLRSQGHELAFTHAFADHHDYTQFDIDDLVRAATGEGADSLVTTAKDEVKIKNLNVSLPCYVLDIQISLDNADRFVELIRNAIAKVNSETMGGARV